MNETHIWDAVGIDAGTCEIDGKTVEVVGIIYPLSTGDEDIRYLTIPAAKALLIDLQDAINACMEHQGK